MAKKYRPRPISLAILVSLLISLMAVFPTSSIHAADDFATFLAKQGTPPPGANDPECRPDAAHPEPIVLVPGTFETMSQNWANLAPYLAKKGYCVYSLNYGFSSAGPSTGPIEQSANELKTFVDQVLAHTGAEKVSIIGHSQGGMMPRYYIKFLGGAEKVDDLIGLAPSNHGTLLTAWGVPLDLCVACQQQGSGSDFLKQLNNGDETPDPVSYTVIATKADEIVIPYTSAFLNGPSTQVTNITLQDYYPLDWVGHVGISYDPNVYRFVLDALEHAGPADPDRAVR
jgi:triacylglycerol lipase